MQKSQQQALISFSVSHQLDCSCNQCKYFGGILELFKLYSADQFTDLKLRKVWAWLKNRYWHISQPLPKNSPPLSLFVQCMVDSMKFEFDPETQLTKYLLLEDILCLDSKD